jgi:hydroxymethylpyrimidine/phosphomethylpyrimidine kinase
VLASGLAQEKNIIDAAWQAKIMVTRAIENALSLGKGHGSVNVFGKMF